VSAAIRRHIQLFCEVVVPQQTITAILWVLVGLMSVPFSFRNEMILLCLVVAIARFSGMCWNHLIDGWLDQHNIRTKDRAFPSGRINRNELLLYALVTYISFLLLSFFFSMVGQIVALIVAVSLVVYSYLKRVSCFCHFFLGFFHGMLPLVGACFQIGYGSIASYCFCAAAWLSVTGTDILYALQDERFDRACFLYSLPSRYGKEISLYVAFFLHFFAWLFLCIACWLLISPIGYIPLIGGCGIFWRKWQKIFRGKRFSFSFFLSSMAYVAVISLLVERVWIALL